MYKITYTEQRKPAELFEVGYIVEDTDSAFLLEEMLQNRWRNYTGFGNNPYPAWITIQGGRDFYQVKGKRLIKCKEGVPLHPIKEVATV
jgi:hypothetical protein